MTDTHDLSRRAALSLLATGALALSGCAREGPLNLQADAMPAGDLATASQVDVLVTTLRAPAPESGEMFSGNRSPALNFADLTVTVPRNRKRGAIILPTRKRDLASEYAIVRAERINNASDVLTRLNRRLEVLPFEERRVFLFVHGYNVGFNAGVFRQAQLVTDQAVRGVALHYSWPSANSTGLYLYDRDSAEFARKGLVDTLGLIRRSKAGSVVLLGHSMGAFLVMEALRTASLKGEADLLRSLEAVILAAPDIDVDVFNQQLIEIEPKPLHMVVLVSKRDRALQVSQRLRGGAARVGEGADAEDLRQRGVIVVDLSGADSPDRFNHSAFASSDTVRRILGGGFDPLIEAGG
jgi:esterase/lipase superfamily enzyme